jgi:putative RNA 2'-phosphotransferase
MQKEIKNLSKKDKLLKLSKKILLLLRHCPGKFGVSLNTQGWANLSDVAMGLRRTEANILDSISCDSKERFQISANGDLIFIRATYGHTLSDQELIFEPSIPDAALYTTVDRNYTLRNGLFPIGKKYIHLNTSTDLASTYRLRPSNYRTSRHEMICKVNKVAEGAENVQAIFYKANSTIWLSSYIPSQLLEWAY